MAWVALVGVDTTVSTVCAAAGFLWKQRGKLHIFSFHDNAATHGSLLNDDALDVEVLKLQVLGIRVRLSVFEETGNEFNRLLRPATWNCVSAQVISSTKCTYPELP